MIDRAEAEGWLAMSDRLKGQASRIKVSGVLESKADWAAIDQIEAASRYLFSAYAWIARQAAGQSVPYDQDAAE